MEGDQLYTLMEECRETKQLYTLKQECSTVVHTTLRSV